MSHNWRNILISPSSSIHDAIIAIDKEALRLALVVDEKNHLLGTVTDGDIRRALLNQKSLSDPVSLVMNAHPKVVDLNTSKEAILVLMEKNNLLSIPIVENGVLVGLETLQQIVKRKQYDNPVFLMAGGFGTRLRPLTDNCPKPLLKIGNKPILQTILESFIAAGFHQFYISTHYMSEMIMDYFGDGSKWGVDIHYIYEDVPLGTGGALGLLPKSLPDLPIILMNGDVLTKVDFEQLLKYHNEHNPVSTMCVREYEYQVPYGVIESNGHKIISMVEKPTHKFFVNAGIYVVSQELIKSVNINQKIDMPTLLEQQIAIRKDVVMFPVHEYWLDIGKMHDFEKANLDFQQVF